jgi:epoxyqueuosine reductase
MDLGFIAIGFSRPERPLFFDHYRTWLSHHKNADMSWLERNMELREDPSRLLKGCRTIISLAFPYPSQRPTTPDGCYVARYASPSHKDYHARLRKLGGELADTVKDIHRESRMRICVDSAPVLEKSVACAAGIGFLGKNNLLIIPEYGSYFYLTEILTTAPIEFQLMKPMENQCGTCTLCMDACPTGALEKPFWLDAARCLSYLSIEYRGKVEAEFGRKMGHCFFGCDRCQEACPFNRDSPPPKVSLPPTDEFLGMDEEAFKERFGKSAFARVGLEKIKSNIRAIRT